MLEQMRTSQREGNHSAVLSVDITSIIASDRTFSQLLRGISLRLSGETGKGITLLSRLLGTITAEDASEHGLLSELGQAHLLLGRADEALELFRAHLEAHPDDAVTFGRLASAYLAKDMAEEAVEHYREAVRREPGRAEWHNNLASVLLSQQLLEEALENYDVALRLKPDLEPSKNARDKVLVALGRTSELVEALEVALNESPESVMARVKLGRALAQANRHAEAVKILLEPRVVVEEILARESVDQDEETIKDGVAIDDATSPLEETADAISSVRGQIAIRASAAEIFVERSMHGRALALLNEILQLEPRGAVKFLAKKAGVLIEMGKYEEASQMLDAADEEHPDANPIKLARANLYCETGRYEDAEVIQRDLIGTYPGDAQLKIQLGQTLLWTGKLDEAASLFEQASSMNPLAFAHMVNAKHIPDDPKAIDKMVKVADSVLTPDPARITMSFALAEVFEKSKDHDRAFLYLKQANDLTNKGLNYSYKAFNKRVKATKAVYTAEFFADLPAIRSSARTPIFVVGMPRSGTTLTEQILCSHAEVFGAGELDLLPRLTRLMQRVIKNGKPYPLCLDNFTAHLREEAARFYLHGLDVHDTDHPFVVDKMPHNFMHVGLIHTIFPKAKIIHIRRDPRDTALSNYQQNFKAKHGGLGYAFDLENIAHEINSYNEMMAHWRDVLPGRMLEITYEELVADQEAVSREMLAFAGLAWDSNVTNFHEHKRAVRTASVAQVRQKIYSTSKQKWRKYESHLGPLIETLEPETTALWDNALGAEIAVVE
jgi:tetratricopeptide (TPR) repeat protein